MGTSRVHDDNGYLRGKVGPEDIAIAYRDWYTVEEAATAGGGWQMVKHETATARDMTGPED